MRETAEAQHPRESSHAPPRRGQGGFLIFERGVRSGLVRVGADTSVIPGTQRRDADRVMTRATVPAATVDDASAASTSHGGDAGTLSLSGDPGDDTPWTHTSGADTIDDSMGAQSDGNSDGGSSSTSHRAPTDAQPPELP